MYTEMLPILLDTAMSPSTTSRLNPLPRPAGEAPIISLIPIPINPVPRPVVTSSIKCIAELDHMHEISQPEWPYLQHWQDEYLQTDLRDMFDIPGDHTSGQMATFADAVRLGQRSGPYSTCVSDHLHG